MAHVGQEGTLGAQSRLCIVARLHQPRHVHAHTHHVSVGLAVVHHPQPTAIGQKPVGSRAAVGGQVQALAQPRGFVAQRFRVVAQPQAVLQDGLVGAAQWEFRLAQLVELAVHPVAHHHAPGRIEEHEAFFQGLDGRVQQQVLGALLALSFHPLRDVLDHAHIAGQPTFAVQHGLRPAMHPARARQVLLDVELQVEGHAIAHRRIPGLEDGGTGGARQGPRPAIAKAFLRTQAVEGLPAVIRVSATPLGVGEEDAQWRMEKNGLQPRL